MKIAISVPDPLFEAAENLAKLRCIPRSTLYAQALSEFVENQGNEAITKKLNEVYSDPGDGVEKELNSVQLAGLSDESW